MRTIAYLVALTVLACSATAACDGSAREGPSVALSGSHSPYPDKEDEYFAEREALRGGRGERLSGTLRLRLGAGETFQLVDKIEDSGEYRRYVYDRYVPEGNLHVVAVHLYEGGGYLVVHGGVASEAWLAGPPILSPDGHRFIASSSELEDAYSPNRLEIWRIDKVRLVQEFVVDGEHTWGPENAAWANAATVRFVRVQIDRARSQGERMPVRLIRRDHHWTLQEAAE